MTDLGVAPGRANIELRPAADGEPVVTLAFPYDPHIVALARSIPDRRFDWDTKEWWAPAGDWAGVHVAEILARFPELTTSPEVDQWLSGIQRRWVGVVDTARHDGQGWFVLRTRAGEIPDALREGSRPMPDSVRGEVRSTGEELIAPLTRPGAEALIDLETARMTAGAHRCVEMLLADKEPPPARLTTDWGFDATRLRLDVLWDPDVGAGFAALPGADGRTRTLPADPWVVEPLDAFLALHDVAVDEPGARMLADLRVEHDAAVDAVNRSRAKEADPIPEAAAALAGELHPFQWAAVRYALEARRTFLADEQGLGKTVEALATIEAANAYPAIVVCPASLKLNWEREVSRWLPQRSVAVIEGRSAVPRTAEITILNYEVVAAHRDTLRRLRPHALVVDESHYVKNPQAKRTHAVRRLAESVHRDGLLLLLSGTPVLNHPEELVSQLRILDRLSDFGSGAELTRRFSGDRDDDRLHWHLRRSCFVRRRKEEVLPQLPAKRQVVVPVALTNRREYALAEENVVEWLRSQPLDLRELEAKIAATLRAERLAQLGALQRLAARGKLAAALAWIHDFLETRTPLVVFARHKEVQEAIVARFPDALHILGRDSVAKRQAAVEAFQEPDGPLLIVGATRVAGQGITLTRASNVAFVELEWTPALHDQAEDRCHRIGQDDAVTAYYLLASETIDESMAAVLESKRGIVGAVTDGKAMEDDGLVQAVVKELRAGRPLRHLRAVS